MYKILLIQILLFGFSIAKIPSNLTVNHIENHGIENNNNYNNEINNNEIYNDEIDYNKIYKNEIDYTDVDNTGISENKTNNNEIDNHDIDNNNIKDNHIINNNGTDDYEMDSNKIYHNETENYEIENKNLNKNDTDSHEIYVNERNNNVIENNTTYNNDTVNNETSKNEINDTKTGNNEIDNNEIDSNESGSNERDIIEIEEDSCKISVIPPNPNSMCCGVDLSSSNRIVGGKPAGINQYPWMAIIFERSKKTGTLTQGCGGALISSLYVLTAAHCFASDESDDVEPYIVDLGDHDIDHEGPDCVITRGREVCSDGETVIKIAMTISHPMFEIDKSEAHDVALIKLASMAPYTDGIRPICLPTFDINKSSQNNLWLYVAGWGTMKEVRKGKKLESILSSVKRHVNVPFINNQKCNQSVPYAEITPNQVCAGGLKNRGACTGDSGGPLMFNNGGQFEVTGVVSFGPGSGCGQKGKPGVFTNTFRYKEWIFDVINKEIAESEE